MKAVLIAIQPYYVFLIIAQLLGWDIPQKKTEEVRKDFPKDSAWNKRVLVYCSKNRKSYNRIPAQHQPFMEKLLGRVVGEFLCDKITQYESEFWDDATYEAIHEVYEPCDFEEYGEYEHELIAANDDNRDDNPLCKSACLTWEELRDYIGKDINDFYGWHISDLKIYDKPKELGEFYTTNNNIKCEHKQRGYNMDFCTQFENGQYFCKMLNCDKKKITRPPQSWCYVEAI